MIEAHPAAAIFPLLPEPELKEMAKSITAFGLREKIGVIRDGDKLLVLDGRNRMTALQMVGVKDETIESEFTVEIDLDAYRCTPEEYVLMANIERRNLTAGQRRELAGKLAVMYAERQKDLPKEQQTDSLSQAAAAAGVSRRTAATAKQQVLKDAGKKPKTKPKKASGGGLTSTAIVNNLQKSADAITKSGHNFNPETLEEIVKLGTNIAQIGRDRIRLIAEKQAEQAQKIAEAAAEAAARASAEGGDES